jgi:hypothetical protein
LYGFGATRDALRRRGVAYGGGRGFFPMIHQDRFHMWVVLQELNQLRTAIAAIADDSNALHV